MNIAQLIEELKKYPQDAIVEVRREYWCGYANATEFAPVDEIMGHDFTKDTEGVLAGKFFVELSS